MLSRTGITTGEREREMLRLDKFSICMYIYPVPKYSAKYITTRSALDIS